MKTRINSISRSLSGRCGLVLIPVALACFALVQNTQAALPPPAPDGGYLGGNTAEGNNALLNVNTAIGINNTAVGFNALRDNTTGFYNTAVGSGALASNTTGNFNMAIGTEALTNNNANFNLAIGFRVGYLNTTGNQLTGIGAAALRNNTTGANNTAIGSDALEDNMSGSDNTAVGTNALVNNTTDEQTAVGSSALASNTTGLENVAVGFNALAANVTAGFSAAVGFQALSTATGGQNTAVGDHALDGLTTGALNTAIGDLAGNGYTGGESSNVLIGAFTFGVAGESNTIHIADPVGSFDPAAACFIGGISGVMGANFTDFVLLDPVTGQLGDLPSSAQYKKDIDPMDKTSEAIFSLKPVTFHYKNDPANTPQFGLIAEEVAKVNPALVGFDKEGKPHSVQYMKVDAMLLNEFLKEHKKVEEQRASIAELKSTVGVLTAQLKEQAAEIQKVSTLLELNKPAPRTVQNK